MRIIRTLAVALGITVLLAACASSPPNAGPSSSTATSPSSSPSATADAFLLRVTGTVTFGDGTVVHVVETALPPIAGDGTEAATMANIGNCATGTNGWQSRFPSPQWVRMTLTSSYESGKALPENESLMVSGGSGQDLVAWSGAWHNGQAYCASGYAEIPGTAEGLAPVDPGAPLGDRSSWSGAQWGFSLDHERDAPPTMPMSFSECTIDLGPTASAAAGVLTRQSAVAGYAQDCVFGPRTS